MTRHLPVALLLPLFAVPVAAQAPAPMTEMNPIEEAAATITESDVARRVAIIADDSMGGRDTPSRGLELTAQYVADEFKSFGLKPGGENGTWFQRYPLQKRKIDRAGSYVTFKSDKGESRVAFDGNARLLSNEGTTGEVRGPVLLLAGDPGEMKLTPEQVKGHVVMILVDYAEGNRPARVRLSRTVAAIRNTEVTPAAYVAVSNLDRKEWAELAAERRTRVSRVSGEEGEDVSPPALEIHRSILAEAVELPAVNGGAAAVREIPDLTVTLNVKQTVEDISAPNTIGVIEGSDPALKNEYLVFSAHMDHVGIRGGQPDSIYNGADDDASGTTGVIELAEAFSQPGARPKRSVIFMTVSGEEKGLWGSE
ncbi:MAG: M28 family peptidase, partial [Gemmatimonadales bacterium]